MLRLGLRWVSLVGVASLLGACATGGGGDDDVVPGEDAGGDVESDGALGMADSTMGSSDGTMNGTDTGTPGTDTGTIGELDGSRTDSTMETDSGTADAEGDSTTLDSGHDSGEAKDSGEADTGTTTVDSGKPDTGTTEIDSGTPDTGTTEVDSGQPDTGTIEVDSGQPDTGTIEVDSGVDAGDDDAACPPVTPTFTETYYPPTTHSLSCAASDVTAFYNACFAGTAATCTTWQGANTTCDACLEGTESPTGATWGPFTYWALSGSDGVVELNFGGCFVLADNNTADRNCAKAFEYLTECEHSACGVSCYGNSFTNYQTCAGEADMSQCLTEYNTVYTGSTCSSVPATCLGPTNATFEQLLEAIGAVFCE